MVPSNKFYEIRLYFFNGKVYNRAINKLLICEGVYLEIDAMDKEKNPDIAITVSFNAVDNL